MIGKRCVDVAFCSAPAPNWLIALLFLGIVSVIVIAVYTMYEIRKGN